MLDAMQIKCNHILQGGGQDNDFMLKVFNAIETLEDEDFLDFIKKKCDLWEEDKSDENAGALVRVHAKKCNNATKIKTKKRNTKA